MEQIRGRKEYNIYPFFLLDKISIDNVAIDSSKIIFIAQKEYLKMNAINTIKTNKVKSIRKKFKVWTS